jgi:hypothetical protein
MPETSQELANSLYPHLSPADRERALANLNRYFEIVLRIFLRRQQESHSPGLTTWPHTPKLGAKGRFFNN